jgi:hypothetical protein
MDIPYSFQDIRCLTAISRDLLVVLDCAQQQLFTINLAAALAARPDQQDPADYITPLAGNASTAAGAATPNVPAHIPLQSPRSFTYNPTADTLYILDGDGEIYKLEQVAHPSTTSAAAAMSRTWSPLNVKHIISPPSNSHLAMAFDDTGKTGRLFISCSARHIVMEVQISEPAAASVYVGRTGVVGCADGARLTALLQKPRGVAVSSNGLLYIADYDNGRLR